MNMELTIGQVIKDRFEVVRKLGQGGFGITYLAQDKHNNNKLCVVKQLECANLDSERIEKAKELFERESEVLAKLHEADSPSLKQIPQRLAYLAEDDQFYLIQEYIEGRSFREELQQRQPLNETEVAHFLKEVLTILKFVHRRNIIHRDIKPDNLMVRSTDGKIVLIDFGSVKEKIQVLTQSNVNNTLIGSQGYSPPEQFRGNPNKNSDIYSLGMTSLEALTGIHPKNLYNLDPDDDEIIVADVLKTEQIFIHKSLEKIIQKMIEGEAKKRYQSVDAVLYDLEVYLQSVNVQAPINIPNSDLSLVSSEDVNKSHITSNSEQTTYLQPNKFVISLPIISIVTSLMIVLGFIIFQTSNNSPSNPIPTPTNSADSEPPIKFVPVSPNPNPEN